jgi:hypothetical protein
VLAIPEYTSPLTQPPREQYQQAQAKELTDLLRKIKAATEQARVQG